MRLKIATWNINSVRLRIAQVVRFLESEQPDVLCLQETKSPVEKLPRAHFDAAGYREIAARGEPGYNGVLTLARVALGDGGHQAFCGRADTRHQWVGLPGGIALHNFYVPAGGDTPDPAANPKFAHKLQFLDEMRVWSETERGRSRRPPAILLGDLNIAPSEHDVWSHRQLRNVVSHTEPEITRLRAVQAAGDWVDAVRSCLPEPRKVFTWWSYRARDWRASDRGRRLDHIWITPDLVDRLQAVRVCKEMRGWPQPSDHVPVIAEFVL